MKALTKIIIVGAGQMGSAIALGLRRADQNTSIVAIDPDAIRRTLISNRGITATETLPNPITSEFLILATTPQDLSRLLKKSPQIRQYSGIIISVLAGISISELANRLNCSQLFRAMPNLPCIENEGVTILTAAPSTTQNNDRKVKNLLSKLGLLISIKDEGLMDGATALVGGGPAYFSFFASAIYEYAISVGFDKESSSSITTKIMSGTSTLIKLNQEHPMKLCEKVMTPGGTTQQAIEIFEKNKIKKIIIKGLKKACAHSAKLGRSL